MKAGRTTKKLEWEILRRILGLFGSSLDISQILNKAAELIVDLTSADGSGIFLLNETGDELNLVAYKNLPERFYEAVKVMKLGEGFVGTVVRSGKPQWRCTVDDIHQMPGTSRKEMYITMKRKYPRSAKRVVFMTGDTTTPSTQDFLDSTGRPYLSKPFDSKKIASLVKGTL